MNWRSARVLGSLSAGLLSIGVPANAEESRELNPSAEVKPPKSGIYLIGTFSIGPANAEGAQQPTASTHENSRESNISVLGSYKATGVTLVPNNGWVISFENSNGGLFKLSYDKDGFQRGQNLYFYSRDKNGNSILLYVIEDGRVVFNSSSLSDLVKADFSQNNKANGKSLPADVVALLHTVYTLINEMGEDPSTGNFPNQSTGTFKVRLLTDKALETYFPGLKIVAAALKFSDKPPAQPLDSVLDRLLTSAPAPATPRSPGCPTVILGPGDHSKCMDDDLSPASPPATSAPNLSPLF